MSYAEFDAIQIGIASPEKIREWSYGEVTKPETINYRTLKPEKDGLYCERIFGPTKDWECHCGRYKKIRFKGKICSKCGVEVTRAKVRRERMGHIELAAPVSHIWYFKGIPSRMGLLLEISPRTLEKVLYFSSYIVTDPGIAPLAKGQILNEKEYRENREAYEDEFDAGMGAEYVKKLLATVGLSPEDSARKLAYMERQHELEVRQRELTAESKELDMEIQQNRQDKEKQEKLQRKLENIQHKLENIGNELERTNAELETFHGLDQLSEQLHAELKEATGQKKARIVKRLEVVDAFRASGNKPEWMIIEALPVLPPELRPMVQLDGGRFATSDLNDLYRRVINRNRRLVKIQKDGAPDIIARNEKRMLQEAVDSLIDNGRRGRAVTGANNRALKSLSDFLKGKQGRFRQNLLGKRVDYSGRSVIVVGPELKIYQCGVPKEMAVELFRPFVMKKLVEDGVASNIKAAKKMVDKGRTEVWDALEFVIKDHPVMLNRAPTLHRLGIQAFEPVLVEGRALKLHPLVCTAFNADFDGDQMAIHVPLSAEAQTEARVLMLSANNLLRPQDGGPVTVPTQDMVLGSYYLTFQRYAEHTAEETYADNAAVKAALDAGEITADKMIWVKHPDPKALDDIPTVAAIAAETPNGEAPRECLPSYGSDLDARLAYDEGVLDLHVPIMVRRYREVNGEMQHKMVRTTVGRLIFNEGIPQDLGFVDREDPETMFEPEINFITGKKQLGKIIDRCINKHGFTESARVLDVIKAKGYKFSTRGSLTVSIYDMTIPQAKYGMIAETEQKVVEIDKMYRRGKMKNDERYRLVVKAWEDTTAKVSNALLEGLDRYNPIWMMADSGARGSSAQIRQLAGMRGLMADTSGRTIEIPIKSNFREGLSVLEYFISSRGARKGMADTALRTADSGYLTRRLVDVSQEVIIREDDCGTDDGIMVSEISEEGQVIETFGERLKGRYVVNDVFDPVTGELLISKDHMMVPEDADLLEAHGIHEVKIRSVLTCRSRSGVCSKCYGINLAIGEPVGPGEAVGIIAAQSIGEPGTQLTMRTFHTGGVAGGDITQGLPRVEELFESRRPKKMAQLAEISGRVTIEETKRNMVSNVTITASDGETVTYALPHSGGIRVKNGQMVEKGFALSDGALYPQDVIRIRGVHAVYDYLIREVQKPYRQQGVDINDKHIEVICRQMMRKVRVEDAGDSNLLSGSTIEIIEFEDAKAEVQARIDRGETNDGLELKLPTCTRLLMGITKASLATESFLSAASFQETTKVLTEAAIKGKVDHLLGLKENVIIGKLIPAGSGLTQYRKYDKIEDDYPPREEKVEEHTEPAEDHAGSVNAEADAAPEFDEL